VGRSARLNTEQKQLLEATVNKKQSHFMASHYTTETISKETHTHIKQKYNWATFDSYVDHSNAMGTIDFNAESWHLSSCNCWHFKKRYHCKHIIALALRKNIITIPASYYGGCIIGQKPKKGRPPRAPLGRKRFNADILKK
jgi:hypothetical protein